MSEIKCHVEISARPEIEPTIPINPMVSLMTLSDGKMIKYFTYFLHLFTNIVAFYLQSLSD